MKQAYQHRALARALSWFCLACCALCATPLGTAAAELPATPVLAYHESWWERAAPSGDALTLSAIPRSVDVVALAFAKPDLRYDGNLDLAGTGLQYVVPGPVVRDAIRALRRRNQRVRVVLSVGGSVYTGWDKLNVSGLARLVSDLGLDGIDVDFEPPAPDCRVSAMTERTTGPSCASDAAWRRIVRDLRQAFPRPALLAVTGWSVGAYGQGRWGNATPRSPWTGSMVGLLRAPEGAMIDLLSIMGYGAGPSFDVAEALAAYRSLWPGPILIGIEGPPAAGGGTPATPADAQRVARIAIQPGPNRSPGGVMIYAWLGHPADGGAPAARPLAEAACRALRHLAC